jgi:hypothetical protein
VIHLGKSLLPDDLRSAYQVEEWRFPAWSKTLMEVLHEFKLRKNDIASKWWDQISDIGRTEEHQHRRTKATDYSRMNYEELRKIADNDPVADSMSSEEYESLSIELWRKFSLEKGLR